MLQARPFENSRAVERSEQGSPCLRPKLLKEEMLQESNIKKVGRRFPITVAYRAKLQKYNHVCSKALLDHCLAGSRLFLGYEKHSCFGRKTAEMVNVEITVRNPSLKVLKTSWLIPVVERSIESVSHVKSGHEDSFVSAKLALNCRTQAGDWMFDVSGMKTRPEISNGCCASHGIRNPNTSFSVSTSQRSLRRLQIK